MSPQTLFEQHSQAVLTALEDGASIPDAARHVDVGESTVKGWLRRGRADGKSKYGAFAASVDAALAKRKLPDENERPADRDELLLLASRAARAGNVQAMRLLSELLAPEALSEPDEFDELRERRRRRVA